MIRPISGLAALTLAAGTAGAAETYTIDPSHTYGNFEIGHMGLSTMHGRIDVTEGTIVMDREGDGSRVDVTLDPASVDTGHAERDKHLREKAGFFEVEKYPEMRFESTRVRFDGEDEATVEGELTLHGETRPVTLEVDDILCKTNPMDAEKYTCGFSAETEIKRSEFGMDAFVPMVSDEVEIQIEAEASRPADA
ncbi:YceI family protein [Salinisphaera orenii]|uniref:Polyisoprenoid-binding protein n=1 Tax=Salinisphaera orenii YIM 95161 TaxID=1051139 RepID=A0A423PNM5_9GAMM|nr:YceI family protein [Salinisphaera halophila]ROO27214.1 polyisoprenoid-binding protein [Salinisphaera halophila YIM 95161]